MKIMGIDPGFSTCAVSLIEGKKYLYTHFFAGEKGKIRQAKKQDITTAGYANQRLAELFWFVYDIVKKEQPDVIGIEGLTLHPKTRGKAIIDTASGVTAAKLAVITNNRAFFEVYPIQLRKYCLGKTAGTKEEIQKAVKKIFSTEIDLSEFRKSEYEHVFDSIAIAYVAKCRAREVKELLGITTQLNREIG